MSVLSFLSAWFKRFQVDDDDSDEVPQKRRRRQAGSIPLPNEKDRGAIPLHPGIRSKKKSKT